MRPTKKLIVIADNDKKRAETLTALVKAVNRRMDIVAVDTILEAYTLVRKKVVALLITAIEFDVDKAKEYPGFRLIRQIRKHVMYQFLPIIAISASEEHRKYAYRNWNCVGYFVPPIEEDSFKNLVARMLVLEEKSDENNEFSLRKDNIRYVVRVKDLMYVESYGRALHVHMADGSIIEVSQKPIQHIIKLAKSKSLVRCARGTLVNKRYISNVNIATNCILLDNDTELKIGSTYVNKMREVWNTR